MVKLSDRVNAELENIQQVLNQFPKSGQLRKLSGLELAGAAALLHNFYNGIENILKQIVRDMGFSIPQGQNWHRDLLDMASQHKIITQSLRKSLNQYLAFRHFFSHAYAFDLDPDRIAPLVQSAHKIFKSFEKNAQKYRSRK